MTRSRILAVCLAMFAGTAAFAADEAVVGSARFPASTTITIDGKPVNLVFTGAAMRVRFFVNVYAIGSYLQSGTGVHTAAELARTDAAKRLYLVMQRDVAGRDVAESFRSAIRQNYPEPAFNDEVGLLVKMLREGTARKGEEILLTHIPGVGLQVSVTGRETFLIKNAAFSRAVWDIYLGYYNVSDAVKKGLTSAL